MSAASAFLKHFIRTMINGAVITFDDPAVTGKPVISVTIANASDQRRSMSLYATVDTGFTGFLTLRPGEISYLSLSYVPNQPAVLADGSVGYYDVYAGLYRLVRSAACYSHLQRG